MLDGVGRRGRECLLLLDDLWRQVLLYLDVCVRFPYRLRCERRHGLGRHDGLGGRNRRERRHRRSGRNILNRILVFRDDQRFEDDRVPLSGLRAPLQWHWDQHPAIRVANLGRARADGTSALAAKHGAERQLGSANLAVH